MSYSFIDTTELQNIEQLLPEEALQFNGVWLDQAIPGFRTLTVAGRESVESEIKTNSIDAQDGVNYQYARYLPRTITVAFRLEARDSYEFRALFNELNRLLLKRQGQIVFADEPDKLLTLAASDIMEKTGDVFDSDYYIVDTETHIVYRKEQFSSGTGLPVEMIVRDRRYTKNEITAMCENVGFEVLDSKYTNASGWNKEYDADSKRAKEILVVCKKK